MSTLLQTYEEDYKEAVKHAQDDLAALRATIKRDGPFYKPPPASGTGSRVQRGAALTTLLTQIKELISNMEYECNDVPAASRAVAKERVAGYRNTLRKLEDDLSKTKVEASAADREDLIGAAKRAPAGDQPAAPGDLDDETKKHRMQMMDNTQKYKDASNTLNKAERLLNDTETVGGQALTTLRAQTEQLQRINETTIAVDEEVSEARRILQGMQKVMIKHKLILIAVILVLIFLIVVAIYVGVSKSKSNATVKPTQTTVNPITTSSPTDSGSGGLPSE